MDTVTSQPRCFFVQRWPKVGKDRGGSFKLFYASTYNRKLTTTRPIYQFNVISCVIAFHQSYL